MAALVVPLQVHISVDGIISDENLIGDPNNTHKVVKSLSVTGCFYSDLTGRVM